MMFANPSITLFIAATFNQPQRRKIMNKLLIATFVSMLLAAAASADHPTGGKYKNKLISKLELTEEQKQPVAEILKEQWKKGREIMQPAFEQVKPQMEALHEETRKRLAGVLTEDQLQKFDEMSSKRHERMQKRFERR